jgi:hypothetical protein
MMVNAINDTTKYAGPSLINMVQEIITRTISAERRIFFFMVEKFIST